MPYSNRCKAHRLYAGCCTARHGKRVTERTRQLQQRLRNDLFERGRVVLLAAAAQVDPLVRRSQPAT